MFKKFGDEMYVFALHITDVWVQPWVLKPLKQQAMN